MKAFLLGLVAVVSMVFSVSALAADKIVISGEPVVVNEVEGVYVPTTAVTTTNDYYYFTMGNTQRVCYEQANPALTSVTSASFKVRINEQVKSLTCYDYSPDYFEIKQ